MRTSSSCTGVTAAAAVTAAALVVLVFAAPVAAAANVYSAGVSLVVPSAPSSTLPSSAPSLVTLTASARHFAQHAETLGHASSGHTSVVSAERMYVHTAIS